MDRPFRPHIFRHFFFLSICSIDFWIKADMICICPKPYHVPVHSESRHSVADQFFRLWCLFSDQLTHLFELIFTISGKSGYVLVNILGPFHRLNWLVWTMTINFRPVWCPLGKMECGTTDPNMPSFLVLAYPSGKWYGIDLLSLPIATFLWSGNWSIYWSGVSAMICKIFLY